MTEDNKLTKPSAVADMFKPKKYGIAAQREQAQKVIAELNPQDCPHRLGIVFDDSGSMGGQPIKDAQQAVRNFSMQCQPKETSLAIYPLNKSAQALTCNYDLLNIYVSTIGATGGTPLYGTTIKMLDDDITRGVLFSDGDPTDSFIYGQTDPNDDNMPSASDGFELTVKKALAKKVPLDCIYIGIEDTKGYRIMKSLAEKTGGIFIHFKDSLSLSQGLKYLTPALRGLLANSELKAKIERGEQI